MSEWKLLKIGGGLGMTTIKHSIPSEFRSAFRIKKLVRNTFLGIPYSYAIITTHTKLTLVGVGFNKRRVTSGGLLTFLTKIR